MKKEKLYFLFVLYLMFLLSSCSKLIPTEFWKNYKTELIVENVNDQGPYGGHRAIYWKTKTENTFDSANVIEFAKENGWELTGKEKFNSEIIRNWKIGNKLIFPLSYSGFQPKLENDRTYENFPRWINSNITVYKFKTNFITIEPGVLTPIKQEYYSKFRLLIMRLIFSLKLDVYPGSISPLG